jgi:hypothetical protein
LRPSEAGPNRDTRKRIALACLFYEDFQRKGKAMFIRADMTKELVLMAYGRKTHLPAEVIAVWALGVVKAELPAPAHNDELRWLNDLWSLEDPRV